METKEFTKSYKEAHELYPNTFIMFRCGQFYMMYGQDAEDAVKILNLTSSITTKGEYVTGFTHGCLEEYLPKLVKAGKRVAIMEDYFTKTV